MTTFFVALWIVTALYSILFFVLYVGVVRLRISDAQVKVHRPGILFRRQRYVECSGCVTNRLVTCLDA